MHFLLHFPVFTLSLNFLFISFFVFFVVLFLMSFVLNNFRALFFQVHTGIIGTTFRAHFPFSAIISVTHALPSSFPFHLYFFIPLQMQRCIFTGYFFSAQLSFNTGMQLLKQIDADEKVKDTRIVTGVFLWGFFFELETLLPYIYIFC